MSLRSFFMARFYDASMQKIEEACFSDWREKLLSDLRGDVLEIGSGTGVNLSYYPASITSLVLTEPEPHMLDSLREKVNEQGNGNIKVDGSSADSLNFPEASFDCIVSTLVLCSVESPAVVLQEIRRLLKPGGKFYFLEHVLAKEKPHLIKWQKFFQPFWIFMCGNCHLTRDTETYIANAGFKFDQLENRYSTGGPPIVSPTIMGTATRL